MCGICGILSSDGEAPDRDLVETMNQALLHRGPDGSGSYAQGPLAMAMRRLSIIDIEGGDQPKTNEDGSVVAMLNGEIYNYRELAEGLRARGHVLTSHSDTEVIPHLYEELGTEFFRELRGMFAVSVWDVKRQRLVLGRDRYGIKPLYVRDVPGSLAYGSELKSLMRLPGLSREVDLEAVEAFLALNFIPAPLTIFKEVRKLMPGHVLIAERGETRTECFARPGPVSADAVRRGSEDELAEELRGRLRDSVRAHLTADVPVGVLLSGGIDSGTLAALAADEVDRPIDTFTIGFKEKSFSEADLARTIARRYGTSHHELIVDPDAVELLPKLIEIYDEPFADSSALPTYLVSRLAAGEVKVVLSGEGADELFGGYYTYLGDIWAPRIGPLASSLRKVIERLPSTSGSRRFDDRLKRFARGAHLPQPDRHAAWSRVFAPEARDELMLKREPGADALAAHRLRWQGSEGAEELSRAQDLDFGVYMVDNILVKVDRASMANSLEARVPFLDPTVVDFAFSLPAEYKVKGWSKKRLLRKAAAPLLTPEVRKARKRGFNLPVASWFRGELQPFARSVLARERIEGQGLLNPEFVSSVLETHVSGREDLSRNIWGLICLTMWHERYIG